MNLSLVSHFFNEELLIGDWVKHHAQFFNQAILIDHHSTDRSAEIAESLMPPNWSIRKSTLSDFDARLNDAEIMRVEEELPGWKVALNTTEWLFCWNIREQITQIERDYPETMAIGTRPVSLIDTFPGSPLLSPIWKNRTTGILNGEGGVSGIRPWRFIHRDNNGKYTPGRHSTSVSPVLYRPDILHLHMYFSPWPMCKERKLQIQTRIPLSDKRAGFGVQHIVTSEQLEEKWELALKDPRVVNLLDDDNFNWNHSMLLERWQSAEDSKMYRVSK